MKNNRVVALNLKSLLVHLKNALIMKPQTDIIRIFSFLSVEKSVNNLNDIPLINKFEKICNDQQKLKIDYVDINTKNTDTYYLEPKCVKIINRQGFLQAYDTETNELKLFLLRNIRKVVQRPQKKK